MFDGLYIGSNMLKGYNGNDKAIMKSMKLLAFGLGSLERSATLVVRQCGKSG